MKVENSINFDRITQAIDYIHQNFKQQPNLDQVAEHVHLSPFHFQRIFTEWAGVSPKKFLQYISVAYAKRILKEEQASLLQTSLQTGLSGASRLHDLFINIEGMTPAEYKNGGSGLTINYSFADTLFGQVIVASTKKGVCYLAFTNNHDVGFNALNSIFPNASFHQYLDMHQQNALFVFHQDWNKLNDVKLHLKGTEFQLKVWEALIKVPSGKLTTYGNVANQIDKPKASRAVGSAVGDNPVAYLIPCHRVIRSTGHIGEYHWGSNRKTAMIGWEGVEANEITV